MIDSSAVIVPPAQTVLGLADARIDTQPAWAGAPRAPPHVVTVTSTEDDTSRPEASLAPTVNVCGPGGVAAGTVIPTCAWVMESAGTVTLASPSFDLPSRETTSVADWGDEHEFEIEPLTVAG